ncbi:MAG: hypothetical protein IMZ53_12735 [Thermoplasmata archaeon]|nr:hypothetical protein [Thermoplasmata archaeon]
MSHITKIAIEINNIEALKSACKELGFTFLENQKTYRWYGRAVNGVPEGINEADLGKCLHAIKVDGAEYEIGVVKLPNGKYTLLYDGWGSGRGEKLIKSVPQLTQMYGVHYTTILARQKGQTVSRSLLYNGSIQLRIGGRF